MFTHLKNIESAFQQNKRIVALVILTSALISIAAIYFSFAAYQKASAHIYVLANGKAMEAVAADRKDNIPVEARDHIKMFHHYFFTLDPDEKVIEGNISKALYLADESARNQYNGLKEKSYYNNLISGNISQQITVDSVQLNMNSVPYYFKCYATEKLIRATSTINKLLITQGYLRNVSRSDNNPHGFLIEHWETIANHPGTMKKFQQWFNRLTPVQQKRTLVIFCLLFLILLAISIRYQRWSMNTGTIVQPRLKTDTIKHR